MNIKIRLLLFIQLLLISTIAANCRYENDSFDSGDLKVLHEKTFPVSPGKKLKVDASQGDIVITSWDKNEVYVKILGNKKAAKKMNFEFDADEETVEVYARKEGSFFNWFGGSGISLRIEVKVPALFNNEVHTSGGDIKIADINGRARLNTSGGNLWIKNTEGEVWASTSGGDINLDDNKGSLTVSTSGGNISATSFDGNLDASTSGGNIKLKGSNSRINAETSGGNIYLEYQGENRGIELSTSGGDIHIRIPEDFNAKIRLESSGGDVSTEIGVNNVKKMSSHKLEGELNKGGNLLNATTSGGNVTVSRLSD